MGIVNTRLDKDKDATPTLEVTVNGEPKTVTMLDADTVQDSEGNSYRLSDVNAAEVGRVTPEGGLKFGSELGITQNKAVRDVIDYGGFNQLETTGKKGFYDREIADLKNAQGQNLGSYLVSEDIVKPTQYTSDETIRDRSMNLFRNRMKQYETATTPVTQARDVVNKLLTELPHRSLGIAESREEYHAAQGFAEDIERTEFLISDLEGKLKQGNLSPEETQLAQEELSVLRNNYCLLYTSPSPRDS